MRHAAHRARRTGDLDMVRAYEGAAQGLRAGEQSGVVAGRQPVVAVQEGDVLAAGRVQTGVAGGGQTGVALVSADHHPLDLVLGPAQEIRRPVGRAVVDEDELEVLTGVGPQTSERVGRECLDVVERHDDGELDHPHHARGGPGIRFDPRPYGK